MTAHHPAARSAARTESASHKAARRPVTGAPRSPSEALALQRSLGNRAVSRLLDEDQHVHEDAPVQRSSVQEVLSSSGTPLAAPVRAEMEARLGADFSDVRLHTGSTAQRSATEIGARAFTSGSHVVIGSGGADKHTLAHELTHVIQQRQGPVAGTDNGDGLSISDPSDHFERAAEANASRVLSGPVPSQPAVQRAATGVFAGAVQRMPSKAAEYSHRVLANYRQVQAEFPGNKNTPVEARVNKERLVNWLISHMEDRGSRGRTVKEVLKAMSQRTWCVTAGVHQAGLGGGGRAADPNRHITLNVGGRGYHVQLMANDEFQNITGG
jgi:hypothetical protein